MNALDKKTLQICERVLNFSRRQNLGLNLEIYIVGGWVRDKLLNKHFKGALDLDFTIEGSAIDFASELNKEIKGKLTLHEKFNTAKVFSKEFGEIDFASCRREKYQVSGALPEVELNEVKIREDLLRRDFTINSLAVPLSCVLGEESFLENVIDVTDGLFDLEAKRIRVLHSKSFLDDPTRCFRALRYAGRLGFNLEEETDKLLNLAIKENYIKNISVNRVINELKKVWLEEKREIILDDIIEKGLLNIAKEPFIAAVNSYLKSDFNNLQKLLFFFDAFNEEQLINACGWKKKEVETIKKEKTSFLTRN